MFCRRSSRPLLVKYICLVLSFFPSFSLTFPFSLPPLYVIWCLCSLCITIDFSVSNGLCQACRRRGMKCLFNSNATLLRGQSSYVKLHNQVYDSTCQRSATFRTLGEVHLFPVPPPTFPQPTPLIL
jgi:hypothetical protein